MKHVLVIDNYDSFVYNLARYVVELGRQAVVRRSRAITLDEISKMQPSHIIISPGPGTPELAGISVPLVRAFLDKIPILGVCLGHQAIAAALGGVVGRANRPMHGKSDKIIHQGEGVLAGLPSPLVVARYHSLIVKSVPKDTLKVTAQNDSSEIMAVSHVKYPTFGVQFHPESVLTEKGHFLLKSFLTI